MQERWRGSRKKVHTKKASLRESVQEKEQDTRQKQARKAARILARKNGTNVAKKKAKGMQAKKYQKQLEQVHTQNSKEPPKKLSRSWEMGKKVSMNVAQNQENMYSKEIGKKLLKKVSNQAEHGQQNQKKTCEV